jgi:hypothetical protein
MIHADLIVVCAASLAGHGLGCLQRSLHHLLGLRELHASPCPVWPRHRGRGRQCAAIGSQWVRPPRHGDPMAMAARMGWVPSDILLSDRSICWLGGGWVCSCR